MRVRGQTFLACLLLLSPTAYASSFPPVPPRWEPPQASRYTTYEFTVPERLLQVGLHEFTGVTGIRVSYVPDRAASVSSPALSGRFTAEEAMRRLLEPSGVDHEWIDEKTVYVGAMTRRTLANFRAAGKKTFDGRERIAKHVRAYEMMLQHPRLRDVLEPLRYYWGIEIRTAPSADGFLDSKLWFHCVCRPEKAIEELFQSPRLTYEWNSDFSITVRKRRWTDPPYRVGSSQEADVTVEAPRLFLFAPELKPATVVDRKQIERLGVSNVAQVLQYLAQQPFTNFEGAVDDGSQGVQLRGFGQDETVVLVDGRRVRSTASLYQTDYFDLNSIPLPAVERIEVYLDSTPFSVGADAIGGVVNIVLKRDLSEPKVDLHYGISEGGARERRVSLSAGHSSEAVEFTAILDYFERGKLLGRERALTRDQDFRRFGGTDFRSLDSSPGNISSLSPDNLPGLPATFAAVPAQRGEVLSIADFLATAGQRNMSSPLADRSLLPEIDSGSAVLNAAWELSPGMHAFGDVLYTRRHTVFDDYPVTVSNVVVPASNPHNPFGVPVLANFMMAGMKRERTTERQYAHGVLGIRGEGGRLKWDIALMRTHDSSRFETTGDVNAERVLSSLAESDPARALNVFDNGPGGTAALLNSLTAPAVAHDYRTDVSELTAQVRADLFEWRAGTSTASLGAQRTDYRISIAGLSLNADRRVSSALFAQWSMPLLAGKSVDGPVALSAGVQGRIDWASDQRSSIANSQFLLNWIPTNGLSVRATYGTAYRSPTLSELHEPVVTEEAPFADPKRGGEVSTVNVLFGGNPDLAPATAESWSMGLTFEPQWHLRLKVTGTYWATAITDRISYVNLALLLSRDELFPGRLLRAEPTAADIAGGLPGRIISLDVTNGGEGSLDARGLDLQASLGFDTRYGRFAPELAATWMDKFQVVEWPGLPKFERVSLANPFGTIPRWHGIAGISWSSGPFEISTKARFVSTYADFNPFEQQRTGRSITAQTLVDVQASVHFAQDGEHDAIWRGVTISAGVNNLLDRGPQYSAIGANYGFDPSQTDPRQRFAYLRFAKEF